jgi:uncharacterized OB-fold protein
MSEGTQTAGAEEKLFVCAACGAIRGYKRPSCLACDAHEFRQVSLPCEAIIYSFTTLHRAPNAATAKHLPYTIVLVNGFSGGLLLLPWISTDGLPPSIGDKTRIVIGTGPTGDASLIAAPMI